MRCEGASGMRNDREACNLLALFFETEYLLLLVKYFSRLESLSGCRNHPCATTPDFEFLQVGTKVYVHFSYGTIELGL